MENNSFSYLKVNINTEIQMTSQFYSGQSQVGPVLLRYQRFTSSMLTQQIHWSFCLSSLWSFLPQFKIYQCIAFHYG